MSSKETAKQEKVSKTNGENRRADYFSTKRRLIIVVALVLVFYANRSSDCANWWKGNSSQRASSPVPYTFQWDQITPTEQLIYHDCCGGLQCARLEVPMDWNETSTSDKIAIAITRLPAKVHVTDPRYGGPILINPGGPGMSGIQLLLQKGPQMQQIADFSADVQPISGDPTDPVPKYHDIISFDPRGVNNSTPQLACFPTAFERLAWNLQTQNEDLIGMSNDSFTRAWARAKALGESCASPYGNGQKLGRHLNTTPVVRDTVAIIERFGEWREKESRRWLESRVGKQLTKSSEEIYSEEAVLERTRWILGQEKLSYWGFSYGTVIGTTFAAMYPDRVHRIILDGVVDVPGYHNSSSSSRSQIQDADRVLDRLLQLCFESGSTANCGLFDPRGPETVKSNLFSILEQVKAIPIPVSASASRGPQIITASDIDHHLHLALYFPLTFAQPLFSALHNLTLGDGTWFADLKSSSMESDISPLPKHCENAALWTPECQTSDVFDESGSLGIECMDGEDLSQWTEEKFLEHWERLREISEVMGSRKAKDKLGCIGWRLRAKWRFTGKTKHPMLLIGNTLDPTTPLHNAYKIARGFPGSGVLQHDAIGHISIAAPSVCTAKFIRRYSQTGELPPNGTLCKVDEVPFVGKTSVFQVEGRSKEDALLLKASRKMAGL